MKYKNALTQTLLKEFRKFQKWGSKDMYSMHGNQEEEFNKEIRAIIRRFDIIEGGVHK